MELILSGIYLIVTVAVIFSMAVIVLQGEKTTSNHMYSLCHICAAIWCGSQILIPLANSDISLFIIYLYGNIGICFAGALWILFSANYGLKNTKVKFYYYIPLILSAINYILILSNSSHHLYYISFGLDEIKHGILFYINVAEIYIYTFIGAITLYRRVHHSGQNAEAINKHGIILIILAVLMPLIFSVLYLTGIVKTSFDITPLGFSISIILVRAATIRYQFFDMKKELDITTEKLILEKERNRIAQQVHDTTGHTLTMLQSYLKLTEVACKNTEKEEALQYIAEARSLTSSGIKELRESINQLRAGDENQLITQGITQLASQVKEIPCEVTVKGEDSKQFSHLSSAIYNSVRESITNTLKYAKASKIDIVIKFKDSTIELVIADDGQGTDCIIDNNGLRGIRERIEKLNGTVKFISSAGDGFMTRITLPSRKTN